MLWPPPLFGQRPRVVQIIGAVVLPVVFGAVCGVVLGSSEAGFNLLMLFAGIGGVLAGFEHAGVRPGALRGLSGGVLFVAALVAAFEVRGLPALARLPASLSVMAVFYAASGVPLGVLGGWLRGRSESRRARRAGMTAG